MPKVITDTDRIEHMEEYPCIAVDRSSGQNRYSYDAADGPWFDSIREAVDHHIEQKRREKDGKRQPAGGPNPFKPVSGKLSFETEARPLRD